LGGLPAIFLNQQQEFVDDVLYHGQLEIAMLVYQKDPKGIKELFLQMTLQ